jgi:hypothetical protein
MQNPNITPEELKKMIIETGSTSSSECSENKGIGYFTGDLDDIPEPLILIPKNFQIILRI